jgi:ribosome maturation factor RimP
MINIQDIIAVVERELGEAAESGHSGVATDEHSGAAAENVGAGLFLVDVKMSAGNEIEVFVDSDGRGADGKPGGVSVEDCIRLTRAIEAHFDRDVDDFSLTVSSAGIGQPLKVLRQYRKLTGRTVEVVLTNGTKITGVLESVGGGADGGPEGGSITVSYPEKRKVEGKKKPEIVNVVKVFPLNEIKTTKEYIDFK